MAQLFFNNARGVLAESISTGNTLIKIKNHESIPAGLASGDYFLLTLFRDTTRYGENLEVVKVTAITAGTNGQLNLTAERGYEYPAQIHSAGARLEARLTAQSLRDLLSEAKTFTQQELNALLDSVPGALDTLNELAAALGDDPEFATTITNALATKLDSSAYTANDVLAKLLTVDGAGSGLDADKLDGKKLATLETEYRAYADQAKNDAESHAVGYVDQALANHTGGINPHSQYVRWDALSNDLPADVTWNKVSDTHSRMGVSTTGVTAVHESMRRCVLNDDATVNYYLDADDSTLKSDGTAADLTGADGQVMVEIPRTYVRYSEVNGDKRWQVSSTPLLGFVLHPAFKVGGVPTMDTGLGFWTVRDHTQEVNYRYIGAYSASVYDTSGAAYVDGLNLDNNDARVDTSTDKLASVSGSYPMVGLNRAQFRTLAANRGTNWNQLDFWLQQLVLVLFITEHGGFNSQSLVGEGNVSRSYSGSSDVQTDSPYVVAGVSNSMGNATGAGAEPNPLVSYRGIEHFWGQCWQWMDGLNVNDNAPYICGDPSQFADDTSSGYAELPLLPASNGYIRDVASQTLSFLPSDSSGSSSVAFSDYYYQNPGWRVAYVGGISSDGLRAGAFALLVNRSSSYRSRHHGGRLAAFGAKTDV